MAKFSSGKRLLAAVGEYTELCRRSEGKKPVFANVAGFCHFAGITVRELGELASRFPSEYGIAMAAFEDAALNSGATATLVGMYLKQYGMWLPPAVDEEDFVCDHDMYEDGV